MIFAKTPTALAACLLAAVAVPAQSNAQADDALAALDAQLPGTLINDPTGLDWQSVGIPHDRETVTDDTIPGGGAALSFVIPQKYANPYDIVVNIPLTSKIERYDTVTAGFWARTITADTPNGKGVLTVRFQQDADPWPGFGETTLAIGPEWKWYEVTGTSDITIRKSLAKVAVQLAGAKQTIEIGQAIVVKGANAIVPAQTAAAEPVVAPVELPPQIAGKGALINQPGFRDWTMVGPADAAEKRDDGTIYLGKATRFTSPSKGANPWDISANVPIANSIKTGDRFLIAIAAKTVSSDATDGLATVGIRVQDQSPPYDGFADNAFKPGAGWQLIQLTTTATSDIAAGQAAVALHFAGGAQVVDIGPVYVLKLF